MILRKIYYSFPPKLRRTIRRGWYFPIDLWTKVTGDSIPLVPPKGKIFTGSGDFVKQGDVIFSNILRLCDLQREDHVLDIGSGIGRVARPMAAFLHKSGSYDGFDIVEEGIEWCKMNYKNYPNFHFTWIPLQNDLYNLSTDKTADQFKFPYPSESFDLIVLNSVFTHMQIADVANYVSEISRMLKKGKVCYCTFFIITDQSEKYLNTSENPFFKYRYDQYYLHDDQVKDANIAFKLSYLEDLLNINGLRIRSLHEGWWSGRKQEETIEFQDVLVMEKI